MKKNTSKTEGYVVISPYWKLISHFLRFAGRKVFNVGPTK